MIVVRPAAQRGATKLAWLDSRHSFSFNRYYDPQYMNFRALRVINDDVIAPGGKFGMHPHQDMEILTWVLEGAVAHQDSTGACGEIRPGDAQKMSAGAGIFHSEANASGSETLRLLQIWIEPDRSGLPPEYSQAHFHEARRRNTLRLIGARDGRDGALLFHQDVDVYNGVLDPGATVTHSIEPGRYAWLQVACGALTLNGVALQSGDGAALSGETEIVIQAAEPAELLLFDLA
ncbi:MAG: pirin family protein [Candidatus Solibacter usitatus]|nr:pirin family protein [Candidatus Solibacter usitatus]